MTLWASSPDPNMGSRARAGWDRLTTNFSDWLLGNQHNPDGTITHTTVTGSVTTIDPSIPKVGTGGNQFVSQDTIPGSLADRWDNAFSFSGFNWSPIDAANSAVDSVAGAVSDAVGQGISTQMTPYIGVGLLALGGIIILEGLAG